MEKFSKPEGFKEIKLAVIGAGRWGFNHVRTANQLLNPDQIIVCDNSSDQKEKIKELNDKLEVTESYEDIIDNSEINSVIISTPAETHYSIAKDLLSNGKNVLIEKPITLFSKDAIELNEIAEVNNAKIMVGHVLLYHPAVNKMKTLMDDGKIGELQYIYSNRLNLGAIRSEENILWSFAPHDVSLIQYITGDNPLNITAHGAHFVQPNIEDTTLTYLEYPNNIKAHIFVSWLHPFKEQRLVVIGSEGMFVFEDSLKTEKLKFYQKGFKTSNGCIEKFDNDYTVIDFESKMPLTAEHIHFYESIINDTTPLTDGKHALEVLKILEKATESLNTEKLLID